MNSDRNNLWIATQSCLFLLCTVFIGTSAGAQTSNRSGVRSQGSGGERLSAFRWQLMPGASSLKSAGGPNLQVLGGGTIGRLPKWTGFTGSNSLVGDSNIFEDKSGKVGIGIDTPTSRLTVVGMIETTLGGLKFPDGTVQTTAGLVSIFHDDTLKGSGTSGAPLGVAVPLNLAGNGTGDFVVTVSAGSVAGSLGGSGIFVQGGSSDSFSGGSAVAARGGVGSGAGNTGGAGITAVGGAGVNGAIDGLAGNFQGDVKVSGDVKLGDDGLLFAPGGEENLRIIRGAVAGNGNILLGSGFTVQLVNTGNYNINFKTAFSAAPVVTISADIGYAHVNCTASACSVLTLNTIPNPDSLGFNFIAAGPR